MFAPHAVPNRDFDFYPYARNDSAIDLHSLYGEDGDDEYDSSIDENDDDAVEENEAEEAPANDERHDSVINLRSLFENNLYPMSSDDEDEDSSSDESSIYGRYVDDDDEENEAEKEPEDNDGYCTDVERNAGDKGFNTRLRNFYSFLEVWQPEPEPYRLTYVRGRGMLQILFDIESQEDKFYREKAIRERESILMAFFQNEELLGMDPSLENFEDYNSFVMAGYCEALGG